MVRSFRANSRSLDKISVLLKKTPAAVLVFVTVALMFNIALPAIAGAATISQTDKEAIVGDWPHWTTQRTKPSGSSASCTTTGGVVNGGSVYMLGDSIGVRAGGPLGIALVGKGYKFYPDLLSSRTLSGGSVSPDGLHAITQGGDSGFIKTANVIVIELGTNSAGLTNVNIDALIKKLRSIGNPQAKIYWVDTVTIDSYRVAGRLAPLAASLSGVNRTIYAQSKTDNYEVISWNKKVLGSSANPLSISPAAKDPNKYIDPSPVGGLGVHPSIPKGADALADLIATTIDNGGKDCSGGGDVTGACNEDKIWNYMIDKGLSPPAVAGLMGNMQAEAHFEPRLVEYGFPNSRGEISVQGQPSSLDDNVPPNVDAPGRPGYGIVQWTGGRKAPLAAAALAAGKPASDLGLQLDNLWRELSGPYKSSVLDVLMGPASSDVNLASDTVLSHFEIPADIGGQITGRRANANNILNILGNGGTSCN